MEAPIKKAKKREGKIDVKKRLYYLLTIPVAIALVVWATMPVNAQFSGAPMNEVHNVNLQIPANVSVSGALPPNDPTANASLSFDSLYLLDSLHIIIAPFSGEVITYSTPVQRTELHLQKMSVLPNYRALLYINAFLTASVRGKVKLHETIQGSNWGSEIKAEGIHSTYAHYFYKLYVEFNGQKYLILSKEGYSLGPGRSQTIKLMWTDGQGYYASNIFKVLRDHGARVGDKFTLIIEAGFISFYASPYTAPFGYSGTKPANVYWPMAFTCSPNPITVKIPGMMGATDILLAMNTSVYDVSF